MKKKTPNAKSLNSQRFELGKAVPFSEIESYLKSIDGISPHKGRILDTNILISANYDVRESHSQVIEVLNILQKTSVIADSEKDEVFNEPQLKKIKKEF